MSPVNGTSVIIGCSVEFDVFDQLTADFVDEQLGKPMVFIH
jgi:hypothetical protein